MAPPVGAGGSEFRKLNWQLRREVVRCILSAGQKAHNGNSGLHSLKDILTRRTQ